MVSVFILEGITVKAYEPQPEYRPRGSSQPGDDREEQDAENHFARQKWKITEAPTDESEDEELINTKTDSSSAQINTSKNTLTSLQDASSSVTLQSAQAIQTRENRSQDPRSKTMIHQLICKALRFWLNSSNYFGLQVARSTL